MPTFTIQFEREPKKRIEGVYELKVLSVEPQQKQIPIVEIADPYRWGNFEFRWKVCFQPLTEPTVRVWDWLIVATPSKRRVFMLKKTVEFLLACGLRGEEDEHPLRDARTIKPEEIEGRVVRAEVKPTVTEKENKAGEKYQIVWHNIKRYLRPSEAEEGVEEL